MKKDMILSVLEAEGLSEFDEIEYKKDFLVVDSYYVFDKAEIEAAISFANDNYKAEKDDTWYEEYYFPYLYDIAGDNIQEVLEELSEDEGVNAQLTICEMDIRSSDRCELLIVVSNNDFDMDKVLEDIEK
ncbi:hypothetical protein [Clostridium cylindrosporum]|uniref:Uncharacterized protein n=1 Tax=Clostridium cylindrosporum DSM 605 TaxID=1121307 RepID=A0A0J8DET5_CLOCY|nr:hypothetical protein [Clostridium cylindrosporum]KMT22693.1 hypothetical protein CLCY_11c00270 [Clostridium cylindrosporum DSM 605]